MVGENYLWLAAAGIGAVIAYFLLRNSFSSSMSEVEEDIEHIMHSDAYKVKGRFE